MDSSAIQLVARAAIAASSVFVALILRTAICVMEFVTYCSAVVREGRAMFDEILGHSRRVEPAVWRKSRSLWTKLLENWAYFVLARVDPYLARRSLGDRHG